MADWADEEEISTKTIIVEGDAAAIVAQIELEEQMKRADGVASEDEDDHKERGLQSGEIIVTNTSTGQETRYAAKQRFSDLGLSEKLLMGVKEMGWETPSLIQATALPIILGGGNVIAQAHHGSGKTGTFSLGMLSHIDVSLHKPQAICLVNTRELAQQSISVIYKLGRAMGAAAYCAIGGGDDKKPFIDQQIIIGTPGRVLSLIQNNLIDVSNIKIVVFDEADTLLEDSSSNAAPASRGARGGARGGRGGAAGGSYRSLAQQAMEVQQKCRKAQTLLFSATFSEKVLGFANRMCPDAHMIVLKKEDVPLDNILQLHIDLDGTQDLKVDVVEDILESKLNVKQTIIFCNTILATKKLTNTLREDQFAVSMLNSKLEQSERLQAVDDFRTGKTKVLVSTNLIARGLDVPDVQLVINFDIPVDMTGHGDCETYLHRIGRCGRFGRKGVSLSLTYDEDSRKHLKQINEEHSITQTVYKEDEIPQVLDAITKQLTE